MEFKCKQDSFPQEFESKLIQSESFNEIKVVTPQKNQQQNLPVTTFIPQTSPENIPQTRLALSDLLQSLVDLLLMEEIPNNHVGMYKTPRK